MRSINCSRLTSCPENDLPQQSRMFLPIAIFSGHVANGSAVNETHLYPLLGWDSTKLSIKRRRFASKIVAHSRETLPSLTLLPISRRTLSTFL